MPCEINNRASPLPLKRVPLWLYPQIFRKLGPVVRAFAVEAECLLPQRSDKCVLLF